MFIIDTGTYINIKKNKFQTFFILKIIHFYNSIFSRYKLLLLSAIIKKKKLHHIEIVMYTIFI